METNCAKPTQPMVAENELPTILLSKQRVRGFSPAFTIEIFESCNVRYTGVANVDVIGERIFKIKKKEYIALKNEFEKSDFKNLEDEYLSRMMDIPKITMQFEEKKIVFFEGRAPEVLMNLKEKVKQLLPTE